MPATGQSAGSTAHGDHPLTGLVQADCTHKPPSSEGDLLIACKHCDTLHTVLPIPPGGMALCRRCGYVLARRSRYSLEFWSALTATALVVFAIANFFPLARLSMLGKTVDASFVGALWLSWQEGDYILSVMTGLVGFWMPLTQLCFLYWALGCIRKRQLPGDFRFAMRLYHHVGPWSMVPVLALAIIVAIVKFAGLATLQPAPGIWAFAVLTFMLTALSRLDSERLWRYAEEAGLVEASWDPGLPKHELVACRSCGHVQAHQPVDDVHICSRCKARVHKRLPDMAPRVWALLIAAAVVYIPANVLPMMEIRSLLGTSVHTILGGVLELWRLGSWDLAIIVFVASVVVPITKLLALAVLLTARRWKGNGAQRQRTRLFELVEFIGQWSMLDVFVVILMAAMANFPGVSQVIAGPAAASFGMVVVLTMLAAMSYDPRTGWDRADTRVSGNS